MLLSEGCRTPVRERRVSGASPTRSSSNGGPSPAEDTTVHDALDRVLSRFRLNVVLNTL